MVEIKQNKLLGWLLLVGSIALAYLYCRGIINFYATPFYKNLGTVAKVVLSYLLQWVLVTITVIIMLIGNDNSAMLGFSKKNPGRQIVVGIAVFFVVFVFVVLVPLLFNVRMGMGSDSNSAVSWINYFANYLFAVALSEEIFFRGYVHGKCLKLTNNSFVAIAVSSLAFGFFHIFVGTLFQVLVTTIMAILWCLVRKYIRGCSLLSLIIAHGLHNFMLVVLFTFI